jgi:hypothetical protein
MRPAPRNYQPYTSLMRITRQIWFELLQEVGLQQLTPLPSQDSFEDWWRQSSIQVQGQAREGFNSLVILGAWVVWKHRNQYLFQGASPSVAAVLQVVREEALLWTLAGARGLSLLQALRTPS